ncbi:MAG: carboxylesterase family protein [Eubacteriales bacterium]|nr:carboxylesterase family protein [Eubacteriales bacterium]
MEHQFISNPETAVVATKQGKVRGYVYDNISIFKGIPYAKARRFHAPEPVEPWEGVLDATSYGYVCPLLDLPKPNGELLVPHRYWVMNEDCQNLNVWTPACDGEKRPVLVWLHGGGYEAGSAIEQVAYEGENMCRVGQVVVVSINHRLNVLGYCDLSDFGEEYANSGNAGTDDIIAALKWVQENIAAFGGDPGNVTVFGQSGGGAKVTTLLQTPAADGLYHKGMNMSGVIGPILADAKGSGKELAQAMMDELGLKDVKELETIPYDALANAYKKVRPVLEKEGKYVGGRPHPNAFYLGTPDEVGFRKETAQIPLLVGTVYGEFSSFRAPGYDKHKMTVEEGERMIEEIVGKEAAGQLLPLYKEAYPERNPVELCTLDFLFRLPTQDYIRLRSALNDCTYAYLFNYDLPLDGGREPWHCSDIPYVFYNTELVPITQEAGVTEKLEKEIFDSVMAFAQSGNPENPAVPKWPASSGEEERTMVFGKETKLRRNFDAELVPLAAKYLGPALAKEAEKNKANIQH